MSKKDQKLNNHTFDIKFEAITLKESGLSYSQIANKLNVSVGTIKTWWFRYRKVGKSFYLDNKRRKEEYTDQEQYIRKLEMENAVLKKFQEILMKEGKS